MPSATSYYAQTRWLEYRNDSGEQVPAFAILRITGLAGNALTAAKPNRFGLLTPMAVSWEKPVDAGASGMCTFDSPIWVKYDEGDTPALNENYGPVNAQWYLDENSIGFRVIGGAVSGRVFVERTYELEMLGQFDTTVAAGATGTFSVYGWSSGTWTDTTVNVSNVRNTSGVSMELDKKATAQWSIASGEWEAGPLEC